MIATKSVKPLNPRSADTNAMGMEPTSDERKNGSFDVTVIVAPGDVSTAFDAVTSKLFL